MLQLLRPARRATDEGALDALFTAHDLTTRLPAGSPLMGRLNGFVEGLQQRIRTSLGAAVGIAVMGRRTAVWKAALWGGLCGTLPDLDAFIDHGDALLHMTRHRAESLALFVLTLAAPVLAGAYEQRLATLAVHTLSASAYEDLRQCPYRFFAQRMLGLRAADELDAEVDKRDFGLWLHAVLQGFHAALAEQPLTELAARSALLERMGSEVTAAMALPMMRANGWGRVVNIASAHGLTASPY
eukprot:gene6459-8028_t